MRSAFRLGLRGGWRLKTRLVGATYNDGLILVDCFYATSVKRMFPHISAAYLGPLDKNKSMSNVATYPDPHSHEVLLNIRTLELPQPRYRSTRAGCKRLLFRILFSF